MSNKIIKTFEMYTDEGDIKPYNNIGNESPSIDNNYNVTIANSHEEFRSALELCSSNPGTLDPYNNIRYYDMYTRNGSKFVVISNETECYVTNTKNPMIVDGNSDRIISREELPQEVLNIIDNVFEIE